MLTQKEVQRLLLYKPTTGVIFRKKYIAADGRVMSKKQITGDPSSIVLEGTTYATAHLIWLYVYGYLPTAPVTKLYPRQAYPYALSNLTSTARRPAAPLTSRDKHLLAKAERRPSPRKSIFSSAVRYAASAPRR